MQNDSKMCTHCCDCMRHNKNTSSILNIISYYLHLYILLYLFTIILRSMCDFLFSDRSYFAFSKRFRSVKENNFRSHPWIVYSCHYSMIKVHGIHEDDEYLTVLVNQYPHKIIITIIILFVYPF